MTPANVSTPCDVVVIGGGIVGLATAFRLLESSPRLRVVVLEKEAGVARHQTGRNSGVLHSGIYYRPGSLKAANCREGKRAMERFCAEHGVPFEICGKVIVATNEAERPRLAALLERGRRNGVACEEIDAARLRELEPHAAGVAAIRVPETGIVDYRAVCERLAALLTERGATLVFGARATEVRAGAVASTAGDFAPRVVVNCAGLYSDRVARAAGVRVTEKIVPFRGEYFELKPEKRSLCRNLIYPVPDPAFPFLGVHFTRRVGGGAECGPNAVLAFAREGYRKRDVNLADLAESLTYPGFLRLAAKHWRTGMGEMWRSLSKRAFVRALQRLVPEIREEDLEPAPAGVRAQVIARDGAMADDFRILEEKGAVHVLSAPSPAATASLNIGALVAAKASAQLR